MIISTQLGTYGLIAYVGKATLYQVNYHKYNRKPTISYKFGDTYSIYKV